MSRILLVEARFYDPISDLLLDGAKRALAGHSVETVTVSGALEIPAVIRYALHRYDGFVALGCVIRGETTHYETVCEESARGITLLGVHYQASVGNGILTVENEAQALQRADPARDDKGGFAARACLSLLHLRERFTA